MYIKWYLDIEKTSAAQMIQLICVFAPTRNDNNYCDTTHSGWLHWFRLLEASFEFLIDITVFWWAKSSHIEWLRTNRHKELFKKLHHILVLSEMY